MANIIDRRNSSKHKTVSNRKKFLERYKGFLRKSVKKAVEDRSIKDIGNEGTDVTINKKDLAEPSFRPDHETGSTDHILTGNDSFVSGDKIDKRFVQRQSRGAGGSGEDETDDFVFNLTKEEFIDLYFDDMALPNYIKETIKRAAEYVKRRAGYVKEGVPARLNVKKTFENSFSRRLATNAQLERERNELEELIKDLSKDKEKNKKQLAEAKAELKRRKEKRARYLDDTDIRYNHFVKEPKPNRQAVIFCIMDTSASMGEREKDLAKRFFLLLYLFLTREYEKTEIVFIRHTTEAEVVDEETFFYDRQSGGTLVSSALELTKELIETEYKKDDWNIYICQASDGDNVIEDSEKTVGLLESYLLPWSQYYAYVEIDTDDAFTMSWGGLMEMGQLSDMYAPLVERHKHFNSKKVRGPKDIYPVFHELFSKES